MGDEANDENGQGARNSSYRAVFEGDDPAAHKHFAPAAARNTGPILAVLRDVVPEAGCALEVASGTGQHVCALARAFPGVRWQPSDPDAAARASIAAWVAEEGLPNVERPLAVDVLQRDWFRAVGPGLDLIVCINMIHIAPWAACEGLLEGAGVLLGGGGMLYLYGPFMREGRHTAPSNAEFDRSLRERNPAWGVRDLGEVTRLAAGSGLAPERVVDMPANNLSLLFRRTRDTGVRS